jgi:hypothetical protein
VLFETFIRVTFENAVYVSVMRRNRCRDPGRIFVLIFPDYPWQEHERQHFVPENEPRPSLQHVLKSSAAFSQVMQCYRERCTLPESFHSAEKMKLGFSALQ